MDIAITGATGLIGSHLADRLTASGHRVLRFVRSEPAMGGRHAATAAGETARWDPSTGSIDAGALEGLDAVVHLAGVPIADRRWTPEQKTAIRESRTMGTSLMAATIAAATRPPAAFLSGSAVGFYGDTGATPTDESAPAGRDFLAGLVADWEAATVAACDAGVRTVLMRSGVVLDAHGGALAKQVPFFKLGLGGRSGSGQQYLSWIAIDDETKAIEWLLHHDVHGPVNLTAPEPVTNAEFAKALGHALHRPTSIIPMIGPRLMLGRELAATLLLTSQRIVPRVLGDGGFEFGHASLPDALDDLLRGCADGRHPPT